MTRSRASRAIASLLRAAMRPVLAFISLTAVIVGILAMHVWMGGHGSTSHHVAPPTPTLTATTMAPGTDAGPAPGHTAATHTGYETGTVHPQATTAVVAAVTAAAVDAGSSTVSDSGVLLGCAGDCADEMMLGMCVLAMIVVGLAGLLTPAGRALLSTVGRRGPPVLSWMSRPAPTPSLTQLCISRI